MTTTHKASVGANPIWRWLYYGFMVLLAIFFLFPLVYMLSSSFKPDEQVLANSQSFEAFLPIPWIGFENYQNAMERAQFTKVFANSMIIVGSIVLIGLFVNSLFGYALARMRFKGRTVLIGVVVALIIIPFESLAVPLLFMGAKAGWLDTYRIQIAPFIAQPLFIFLFYTFFLGIPKSLEEAARIDGAGPIRVFTKIAVPLARPAYATVAILTFLFSWGQFLWPSIVTRGVDVRPLPVGIGVFKTTPPVAWGDIMAYAWMMTLPLLIIFLIFQKQFVQGVASSGMKG